MDISYLSPLVSTEKSIVQSTHSIQVRVTLQCFDHAFGIEILGEIRNLWSFLFEILQSLWGIVGKQGVSSLSLKTVIKCKTCWCCMRLLFPQALVNLCERCFLVQE